MQNMKKHTVDIFSVESQRGDGNLYSFAILYSPTYRRYMIIREMSTFALPEYIDEWEQELLSGNCLPETLNEIAKIKDCNPCTLAEVVRVIGWVISLRKNFV